MSNVDFLMAFIISASVIELGSSKNFSNKVSSDSATAGERRDSGRLCQQLCGDIPVGGGNIFRFGGDVRLFSVGAVTASLAVV